MAQTAGILNTTLMAWYFEGTKITHSTDGSITIGHSTRDVTTKDSAGWRDLLEGLRQADGTVTFYFANDAAYGLEDFLASKLVTTRATFTALFQTAVTGDASFSGSAYITNVEQGSSGSEDNVSVTVSFAFTGALVYSPT